MNWPVTEVSAPLKKSGQVVLDAGGSGVLTFDPDNARQRWEVSAVVVSTSQDAAATVVPVATVALNTVSIATMSPGNSRGASWSGNQDTFSGQTGVGPCDFLTIAFGPAPGQDGSALAGVTAAAVVTGTKYTRRA
ncbi:MAG TPA: hypothetical protein VGG75_42665 [Trebonia sp.]|jgi:hypothetical protein